MNLESKLSIALVHYPVVDKAGDKVATNVTNFDVHDIARAAQVYAVEKYFIITPMKEQLMFVSRILDHWRVGFGAKFNPMRKTALDPVCTAESLEGVINSLGPEVCVVGTSARNLIKDKTISFNKLREDIKVSARPYLLLFGTGFGLHEDAINLCEKILEPITGVGPKDYRHLSVRSAVSICLDRLLGSW
ncbi:MAG: hypothetical protein A4S09_04245 [Proteobacteria bacterium SG_bin7]|nr:MAG: hypothetical protein A4S09_04245 [Proteobacteria bacterium SG_bin7]